MKIVKHVYHTEDDNDFMGYMYLFGYILTNYAQIIGMNLVGHHFCIITAMTFHQIKLDIIYQATLKAKALFAASTSCSFSVSGSYINAETTIPITPPWFFCNKKV